MKNITKIEPTG